MGHIHHGIVFNHKTIRPLSCYLPEHGRNRRSMLQVKQAENRQLILHASLSKRKLISEVREVVTSRWGVLGKGCPVVAK